LLDGVMVRRATHTPCGTTRAGSSRSCWSPDLATTPPRIYRSAAVDYTLAACIRQLVIGTLFMLHRGRYNGASFEESLSLGLTVFFIAGLPSVIFAGRADVMAFPRATAVLVPPAAPPIRVAGHSAHGAWRERGSNLSCAEKVLILSAGERYQYKQHLLICHVAVELLDPRLLERGPVRRWSYPALAKAPWNMASWISATAALILIAVGRVTHRVCGSRGRAAYQPLINRLPGGSVLPRICPSFRIASKSPSPLWCRAMSAIASEDISSA
jgi:hypothetical protein